MTWIDEAKRVADKKKNRNSTQQEELRGQREKRLKQCSEIFHGATDTLIAQIIEKVESQNLIVIDRFEGTFKNQGDLVVEEGEEYSSDGGCEFYNVTYSGGVVVIEPSTGNTIKIFFPLTKLEKRTWLGKMITTEYKSRMTFEDVESIIILWLVEIFSK